MTFQNHSRSQTISIAHFNRLIAISVLDSNYVDCGSVLLKYGPFRPTGQNSPIILIPCINRNRNIWCTVQQYSCTHYKTATVSQVTQHIYIYIYVYKQRLDVTKQRVYKYTNPAQQEISRTHLTKFQQILYIDRASITSLISRTSDMKTEYQHELQFTPVQIRARAVVQWCLRSCIRIRLYLLPFQ